MEIRLDQSKTPFNLDFTLQCGQAFRWKKIGEWWYGVVRQNVVGARQNGDALEFRTYPEELNSAFIENYFRLDDDLPKIYSLILKDEHIKAAVERFKGLRLMRQEPWECLISYICATNKNIPAIKDMILNVSKRFGKKLLFDGQEFHTFPVPLDLASASIEELRACKLGFRAERVLEASRKVSTKQFSLEALRELSYREARNELMKLPGVGPKVADCVLLFSLDKLEAFPIDVWMKRIVMEYYPDHFEPSFVKKVLSKNSLTNGEYNRIGLFGRKYFGRFVGYAQEYLYHFKRCMSRR
ncbi:MAG: DNA-3-methyladenine glycosylase family protein [Candidatus Bathyarchaeia archaeon]